MAGIYCQSSDKQSKADQSPYGWEVIGCDENRKGCKDIGWNGILYVLEIKVEKGGIDL